MTKLTHQCPLAWRRSDNIGVRACGRQRESPGCDAISYSIGRQYSKVCGRVIGFQHGTPDAFAAFMNTSIDFDGVNITYGVQRNHIWSYVAGLTQGDSTRDPRSLCPCGEYGENVNPPQSIGDNYYCESGQSGQSLDLNLYADDPLWDGQQCEGTCCNGTNSPPWFSVQLPTPTIDGVEVKICGDQGIDDEDVLVQLIEVFVQ